MNNKIFMSRPLYLISITIITSILLAVMFFGTLRVEKEFTKKMVEVSTSDIISISNNSANLVKQLMINSNDYANDILKNKGYQFTIEKNLQLLLTKNIKYAYILYKDEKGVFRFLVDGSLTEKALPKQKFDISNPQWLELYETKKPQLIQQLLLKELSITYLIPILNKNKVELVMVVDFSVDKVKEIYDMINFVKNSILFIITLILIFLLVLIIQTVKYYLVKKTAFVDKLTGLYNRNYLQESKNFINLNEYIIAAVDIDHFKKINDTYGHDSGDKVLKQVAQTILNCTRKKEDIVVRYGGEEFLILARAKRDQHNSALNVLERILNTIRHEKFLISNNEVLNVTVSIGVNLLPKESRTFSEAFKLADISLYNAKNKGRNRLEIYDAKEDSEDFLTINEIKEAIDDDRVKCYYQSVVDTKTQEIVRYEALLRIVTLDNKCILPNMILPVVKGTFISRNLTKQVLKNCFEKLVEFPSMKININLTPQDIANDSVLNILKDYAINPDIPSRLGLEIVENEQMLSYEKAKVHLLELKKLGYELFIDDFGSGYSNFVYLTEVKTDYIKIDGQIINKILKDETSYLIVKNIVNFAKEANIKIVAEFVSNEKIYNAVKDLGIEYSQGFLFSKPNEIL